jgi:hypothetical protein
MMMMHRAVLTLAAKPIFSPEIAWDAYYIVERAIKVARFSVKEFTLRRTDMNDLVRRLSEREHPVEVSLRPDKTVEAFLRSIERGYVHIRFTNTLGGTELGVQLNRELSDLKAAESSERSGHVKIVGDLTLDYVPVRCIADIVLPSLQGTGRLEIASQSRSHEAIS